MKTGRRRPPPGDLQGWARRQVQEDAQRAKVAQAIAWGPPPAKGRPSWLRLGAYVSADGERLGIVSIRPNGRGGWELMGHQTCNRWYDAGEVTPL